MYVTLAIFGGLPLFCGGIVLLARWAFREGMRTALAELADPHNPRATKHLEKINAIRMRRKSWMYHPNRRH